MLETTLNNLRMIHQVWAEGGNDVKWIENFEIQINELIK
jgi:hypothetical protein